MDRRQDNIDQLLQLLLGGLSGALTDEEEVRLQAWLNASPQNEALYNELRDESHLEALSREQRQYNVAEALQRTQSRIGLRKRSIFRKWLPYAAAVAILLTVGWLLLVESRKSSVLPTGQAGESLAATEIQPGGNKATLTLADGRVVNLDEAQTGIVIGDENITYNDGSSLEAVMVSAAELSRWGQEHGAAGPIKPSLDPSTTLHSLPTGQAGLPTGQAGAQDDASVMLALSTPKGGTYQVTLPDGSRVWLNSASTLKYPSRFSGDSREVFLEGEAYFEIVAMDRARITDARERSGSGARVSSPAGSRAIALRAPFKVTTTTQTVEVLGTQFNISAYADEDVSKTTLVEGKVKVTTGTEKGLATHDSRLTTKVLAPGQQATTHNAAIEIREVDTELYTAWKSGYFYFKKTPFEEVMRQLARWYDVAVEYKGNVPRETFSGEMDRDLTLNAVLKLLNVSAVQVQITDGNNLIVY